MSWIRTPAAALGAALLLAALAYAPSLGAQFHFDDWTSIQTNWQLRDPAGLVAGLRPWDLLGPGRPVTDLTFALDLALGGGATLPFHATSLLLHLAAAALAFLLARDVLARSGHPRAAPLAAFAAGAFALHPLQTESVCYAAQRSEVIASALTLASLLLLVRARDARAPRRAWALSAGATAVLLLALGAKTIAVTLPAAFLLHAVVAGGGEPGAPPARRRAAQALLLGAPAWALVAVAAATNLVALSADTTAGLSAGVGPWRYLLTQLRVVWRYARLVFWPAGQTLETSLDPSPGLAHAPTLAAAAGLVALVALAGLLLARAARAPAGGGAAERVAAFGIGWWLLVLAPTSSLVPIVDLVAEHRVYLALLGPLLAAAVAGDALLARSGAGARAALAAAAVAWIALAGALAARAAVWRTDLSLWADAAEKSPASARAVGNHGFALHAAGRRPEAAARYEEALALARTPRQVIAPARNLASLHLEDGDYGKALAAAERGLRADPRDFELHVNRSLALLGLGLADAALAEARAAVALAPGEPASRNALGLALLGRGDAGGALGEFRAARAIDARSALYARHEFIALAVLGRAAEGCAAWAALPDALRAEPPLRAKAAALGCAGR